MATAIACVRLSTLSFPKIAFRCDLTVPTAIVKRLAMDLLPSPSTTSRNTSDSRAVNWSPQTLSASRCATCGLTWRSPRGGFFLWAKLPAPLDAETLSARAVEHGVVYVPGDAFFVDDRAASPDHSSGGARPGSSVIRLSFSAPAPARIQEGVARLKTAIDEEIAAVTGAGRYRSPHREAR